MPTKLLIAMVATVLATMIAAVSPAAAASTCFGAAARDPIRPCVNPTRSFFPALQNVDRPTESPCLYRIERSLPVCMFGTPKAKAKGHIALVGDSHSWHWRAAVDVVARARRWSGTSLTAPGCAFSDVVAHLPAVLRASCTIWYRRAKAWLLRHPEVSTVFMSQLNTVYGPPGATHFAARVAGFRRAWSRFPKTVKHVVVIKDVPDPSDDTHECVARVLAAGTEFPGVACATPRAAALTEDAGGAAMKLLPPKRFSYVDMTQYFCDDALCYPVIGGGLVYRDVLGHINVAYSRSLGPYLLRRVQALRVTR